MELSVIIPAYNERNRLPATLEKIYKHFAKNNYQDFEVLVANDGSSDRTVEIVRELAKQYSSLRLLNYEQNRGRGAVCKDAVQEARGNLILIADADGSTSENSIMPFVQYLREHREVDILIGSRDIKGARIVTPQPPLRVFLNKMFLLMAKILFGWPMHDRVNGFKMMRTPVAFDIYPHQTETSFFAEAELVFIADARGWKVRELPIVWTDDRDSRVKPAKEAWRAFWGMFKIFIRGKKGIYKR